MSVRGVLLDTSAWIAFLSPTGHDVLKSDVRAALGEERVSTCAVVRAELLIGARDGKAYRKLDELLRSLEDSPIDGGVWSRAAALGFAIRRKGLSVPLTVLVIAEACRSRDLELWHVDAHYEAIRGHVELASRSYLRPLGRGR
ncbi:MAG: PIN domain-containing protein [Candidatus Bipolaricaulota bacterium]